MRMPELCSLSFFPSIDWSDFPPSYAEIDLHFEPCWCIIFYIIHMLPRARMCCRTWSSINPDSFSYTGSTCGSNMSLPVLVACYTILILFLIKRRNKCESLNTSKLLKPRHVCDSIWTRHMRLSACCVTFDHQLLNHERDYISGSYYAMQHPEITDAIFRHRELLVTKHHSGKRETLSWGLLHSAVSALLLGLTCGKKISQNY